MSETKTPTAPEPPRPVRHQIVEKIAALVTSAFGLVAALAWNDAIRALFDQYYPRGETARATALLVYAAVVTAVAVLATVWIGRVAQRLDDLDARLVARTRTARRSRPGDDAVA